MAATTATILGGVAAVGGAYLDNKNAGDAINEQQQQNAENKAFIKEQAEKARKDIIPLFGAAQDNREIGAQGAFDVYGQTIPQQFDTFQQGNVGAQQQLLAGLPQIQNAILGQPIDMSALQPKSINYNTDWAQQQVPEFVNPFAPQLPMGPNQPNQPNVPNQQGNPGSFSLEDFLSGIGGIGGTGGGSVGPRFNLH